MNRHLSRTEALPKFTRTFTMVVRRLVPSAGLRNRGRAKGYGVRPHLPVELLVEPGDTVVQVGTPHPRTIERLVRACGPLGRLVVLEAEANNFALLAAHANKLEAQGFHLQVLNVAAGPEAGQTTLKVSEGKPGDHTIAAADIRMDNDERDETITWTEQVVDVVRLDDLEIGSPAVVIVTTNGSELEVLKGASAMFAAMAPGSRVFVKAHARTADGQTIAGPIKKLLEAAAFTCTHTARSKSVSVEQDWQFREGDIFGYK